MAITLPQVIQAYFAADKGSNLDAVAACFTDTATVIDEGKRHAGRAAIRQWISEASTAFSYTVEPFAMATEAEQIIVTSHLVGNFPGSPVDLRYRFTLEGDRIAALEIVP